MRTWSIEEEENLSEYKGQGMSVQDMMTAMSEKYGKQYSYWSITKKLGRLDKHTQHPVKNEYKETIEIQPDGTHKSDKLLRMSSEQSKDKNYLLTAHGYDKDQWELISARSNIWNSYSKQDGVMTLYSSKITVKPRQNSFSYQEFVQLLRDNAQPKVVITTQEQMNDKRLLEIPLYDTHFGISSYDYYKQTHIRVMDRLLSKKWEEVLFVIGQDMLHNDNFRGQTANGTQIESVDMVKAWGDCLTFYTILIEMALVQSNRVKVIFSKGNHDESMSWAFVQVLKAKYPQITYDDAMVERKVHLFGMNFIGVTHGDKGRKNLHNIFPVEFPNEWSKAKNREIHIGHIHVEDGKDHFGMMVRTLATRNKTDKWHKDNGYVGAHKRFMLFEYSEEELESIHYV